tara:strand:+ start:709 stop:1254 length:546 start_codon:yes stop_codon:yes gene_type:complete
MNKLKSIKIKGKDYVEVHERLKYFRTTYPKYSLTTEVIEKTESSILVMAIIKDDNDRVLATGLAEESKNSTFINKTSYVENAETSAWGRALGNLGIGLDTSVASADEVVNAIANQNKPVKVAQETKKEGKWTLEVKDEKWDVVLQWIAKNKKKGLAKLIEELEKDLYIIGDDVKVELKKHV